MHLAPRITAVQAGGHLLPSSLCAPPEAHAQLITVDLLSEMKGACVWEALLDARKISRPSLFKWTGLQGEDLRLSPRETNPHVCSVATFLQKYLFFNDPPTFKRYCCFPGFQRGQKSVVLATEQETQSLFRSFELTGRAGPGMITFL